MPHVNRIGSGLNHHQAQSNQYMVKAGDTLARIARQHGVSTQQLLEANPQIRNPNLIHAGQMLNLPARVGGTQPARRGNALSGLTEATGNGRASDWDRFQNNPNQRLMRRGQRGPDIAALQGRLTELGYMTEAQRRTGPGIFGSLTERAVTRFQRDHGLTVDGVVGPQTRASLGARQAAPAAAPPEAPANVENTEAVVPNRTLKWGNVGPDVAGLQKALVETGYMTAEEMNRGTGMFGRLTDRSVKAFQRAWNLSVDGVVGPQTQGALRRALAGETPPQPEVRTNRTQAAEGTTDTRAWLPVNAPRTNQVGNRSAANYNAVLDQFSVGNNPRYARRRGNTYCNIFVWDATRAMGAEIPHWVDQQGRPAEVGARGAWEMDANDTHRWLENQGRSQGWRKVSAAEAQRMANTGHPVVASWRNPGGIGHIAMVRPSAGEMQIAQAGARNFNEGSLRRGFGNAAGATEFFVND